MKIDELREGQLVKIAKGARRGHGGQVRGFDVIRDRSTGTEIRTAVLVFVQGKIGKYRIESLEPYHDR